MINKERNLQLELMWGKGKEEQDHKRLMKKKELEENIQEAKKSKGYGRKGYGH